MKKTFKLFFHGVVLGVALLLVACDTSKTISAIKVRDTAATKEMLAAFNKQNHRFELGSCDFKYNDTSFDLDMSIDELKGVLGTTTEEFVDTKKKSNAYYWHDGVIVVLESNKTKEIDAILVKLRKIKPTSALQYFLVEGVPLNNTMTMGEFVGSSYYNFEEFYVGNSSYELVIDQCNRPVNYYFASDVKFSYIGTRHARLKDRPDFENTSLIESLEISYYR